MEKFLLNQHKNYRFARKGRGNTEINVYNKESLFFYSFDNLEMTGKFFNIDKHVIRYRLDTGKSFFNILSKDF